MKSELSEKNPYWIDKHRFYELQHFCLQYPIWEKSYTMLDGLSKRQLDLATYGKTNDISNPTEKVAIKKTFYLNRMELITETAKKVDAGIAPYLIRGVTEGLSYDVMNAKKKIPCCRETYYDMYRKFFWLLNEERE